MKLEEQISELEKVLNQKGYEQFNFGFIGVGLGFKEGLMETLEQIERGIHPAPERPIKATFNFGAKTVGDPVAIADFHIGNQPDGTISIKSVDVKRYDDPESPTAAAKLQFDSLVNLPDRESVKKQIHNIGQSQGLGIRRRNRGYKM